MKTTIMIMFLIIWSCVIIALASSLETPTVTIGDESNFARLISDHEYALVKLYVSLCCCCCCSSCRSFGSFQNEKIFEKISCCSMLSSLGYLLTICVLLLLLFYFFCSTFFFLLLLVFFVPLFCSSSFSTTTATTATTPLNAATLRGVATAKHWHPSTRKLRLLSLLTNRASSSLKLTPPWRKSWQKSMPSVAFPRSSGSGRASCQSTAVAGQRRQLSSG